MKWLLSKSNRPSACRLIRVSRRLRRVARAGHARVGPDLPLWRGFFGRSRVDQIFRHSAVGRLLNGVFQSAKVDRFGQMLGEAGGAALFDILGRSIARDRDSR